MLNDLPRHWDREVQTRSIADLVCDLACTWRVEPDGRLANEWLNREQFLGHSPAELADSRAWLELVHADDRPVAEEALAQVFANQDAVTELRLRSKSGQLHWLRLYLRPDWSPALRRVVRVHGAIQDITSAKRSELEKTTLLEVARDIGGTLNIDELLSRVQRRMAQALPCDVVVTFRWDETRQAFCAVAQHGATTADQPEIMSLEIARGTFGGQTERGHSVVINDVHQQPWLPVSLCERLRIQALIAVPLRVRGRHFGTVAAYSTTPHTSFDAAQVELCDAIGRQLALALEGVELYSAQEEQATVSSALARIAQELIASLDRPTSLDRFCAVVTDALGCDVAQTWLWNATEESYVLAAAYGYAGEETEQLRTLRLPRASLEYWGQNGTLAEVAQVLTDEQPNQSLRSGPLAFGMTVLMCMRLNLGDEVIGVQCAGFRGRREPFSRIQLRIAQGIAQIASMALSHARLVDELARVNRLKSDFVATMSHELRTPLNTLMGYTDLLASGEFGPVTEEQLSVLERMDQSARELLDLINATLDLSRIEARRVPIDVGEVFVPELLRELDVETRYQRQRRGLDMAWEVMPDSTQVRSDRMKLKVILKNLVTNAVKFTERGGVRISVAARDAGLEFTVHDTGIGIAPDILPIIFEPFRQGESAHTRRFGGVGLGLYVVRRLLDLLNGSIVVESQPGQGSTFRIWVPSEVA